MTNTSKANVIAVAVAGAFLGGCASTYEPPKVGADMIWSSNGDDERPAWTLEDVEALELDGEPHVMFTGISDRHATQKGARNAAMTDARTQVANYARSEVEDALERTLNRQGKEDEIQNADVVVERVTTQLSSHLVEQMEPQKWRYEQWETGEGDTFFQAFVRAGVTEESFNVDQAVREAAPEAEAQSEG